MRLPSSDQYPLPVLIEANNVRLDNHNGFWTIAGGIISNPGKIQLTSDQIITLKWMLTTFPDSIKEIL